MTDWKHPLCECGHNGWSHGPHCVKCPAGECAIFRAAESSYSGVIPGGTKRNTKGFNYGEAGLPWPQTHAEKCQLAARRRLKDVPPTPQQVIVLEAVRRFPGQTLTEYAWKAFNCGNYFYRKKVENAVRGLDSRGLLYRYFPCECKGELVPYGKHSHKCKACGSLCANVYLPQKRIGVVK